MEERRFARTFAQYVSLNVLGMLGLSCYILADTYFIADRLGAEGLAALNLAIPAYSVVSGLGLMLGVGGATRYAVLKAREEQENANAVFTHAVMLALGVGALLALLGQLCSGPISRLLGASGAVLPLTQVYLRTVLSFAPCFLLNNVLLAFVRNDGGPRLAMGAMLLGSFSNIVLDWVLMYACGMGMFGAAFATGLAPVVSMALLVLHFLGKWGTLRSHRLRPVRCRYSGKLCGRICALGVSALIGELSSGAALVVFNLLILNLEGSTGVAAYGVVANLSLVAAAVFTGISQGIQPMASRFHGLGDGLGERRVLRAALLLSLALAGLLYASVFFGAVPLTAAFNSENDPQLSVLAHRGLKLYFLGFFFAGPNIVAAAFFSALERAKSGFLISVVRGFAALIPLALAFAALFGMDGVWLSFPAAEAAAFLLVIVFLCLWHTGYRNRSNGRQRDE